MCQSAIKSSICPGLKARSDYDTRCRGCKKLAGQFDPQSISPAKSVIWAQRRAEVETTFASDNARTAGVALGESWSRFAERFLIDVLDEACSSQPPGAFALVVAGSLARNQATPFSDLEFFFTVEQSASVVPFAKLARKMWKSLEAISTATGSLSEDLFFHKNSPYNVLTITAGSLGFDHATARPVYDARLEDRLEQFSFGDASYEQLSGSRCIAGDGKLLEILKLNLRSHKNMSPVYEFRDRLRTNVIPEIQQLKRELESGNHTINIKAAILRTILWVTIGLGRCYEIHGVGDVNQLSRLLARRKLSNTVYKMMMNALNYAQVARYQNHMAQRQEADEVVLTPELKTCLRTVSALVEMSDVWLKKREGRAVGPEKKRDCFRTSCPEHYDYFRLARWTV